jgi:putative ATPase
MHLRNAPTALMKELGYGRGYAYPHDAEGGFVEAANLPEALGTAIFYEPTHNGAEGAIAERLAEWRRRRARRAGAAASGPAERPRPPADDPAGREPG